MNIRALAGAPLTGITALAATLAVADPARAQDSGRGFLFAEPRGHLALKVGMAVANAGSDIFSFTTTQLTVDRGDFNSLDLGAELAFYIAPQLSLVFAVARSSSSTASEFREWLDQDDLPIEQTTTFQRVPLTASLRWYLNPRGRSIGSFAWVPSRYAAFVGAGGGAMWYRFDQKGDFVDYNTLDIFSDHFESAGMTGTVHALAGFDYSLGTRTALTTQGKYQWARAELQSDFSGFQRIDLSGFSATVGVYFRF